jgi:hypothetical protein
LVAKEDAMQGRHAGGPEIVRQLMGGEQERQRLETILNTVAGRQKITEAAVQLGISTQRVSTLREIALQAALDALAPQAMGRPPKTARSDQERINALQRKIEYLERELAASKLREEIAVVLPSRPRRGEKKRRQGSSS